MTREEYQTLARQVLEHDRRYHVDNDPIVSDAEYDRLLVRLRSMEQEHPDWIEPWSPSQRVGHEPVSAFDKVVREVPMLSLDNTYDEEDLREFHERTLRGLRAAGVEQDPLYVVELKVDGIGIELRYQEGAFVRGATRGDGRVGEDVSSNLRTIRALPQLLRQPVSLEVRGEVYMERAAFEAVNRERVAAGEEPWKNPRNATGGSLKLLDPRACARRPLRIVTYELVGGETRHGTHWESLAWLRELGLPTNQARRCQDLAEVERVYRNWVAARARIPFDVDGCVVKVDDYGQRRALGATARFPRWAMAYKFPSQQATSRVLGIEANVGKSGMITPVALLEPVELSGTTVKRASLHNWEEVRKKDVRIGDTVLVEKAGEIIPQVVTVIRERRTGQEQPVDAPRTCPACGSPAERRAGEVALRCTRGASCPGVVREAIEFFAARGAMNIENLGAKLVDQLIAGGLVSDPADLFDLTVEKLVPLSRMAEKSAQNVVQSLVRAKHQATLARLLVALAIPHVGSVAARDIAAHFGSLAVLLQAASEPDRLREDLEGIEGIGPKIASAVMDYLADPQSRRLLDKLRARGVDPVEPRREAIDGPLRGLLFCVTGALSKPREDIHKDIEAAGGRIAGSVTRSTHYLVAGDKTGAAKLKAAQKHGAKVIDEAELYRLIAEGP